MFLKSRRKSAAAVIGAWAGGSAASLIGPDMTVVGDLRGAELMYGSLLEPSGPVDPAARLARARAWEFVGRSRRRHGQLERALEAFSSALAAARSCGSDADVSIALAGRAEVFLEHGDRRAARPAPPA